MHGFERQCSGTSPKQPTKLPIALHSPWKYPTKGKPSAEASRTTIRCRPLLELVGIECSGHPFHIGLRYLHSYASRLAMQVDQLCK